MGRSLRSISRDAIKAFYYNEEESAVTDLSADAVIDDENEDQFHVVMEPSPTVDGKYAVSGLYSDLSLSKSPLKALLRLRG